MLLEPLGRGGIAEYTRELAVALAGESATVEVLTARDHGYGAPAGVTVAGLVPWLRASGRVSRALRAARLGPVVNALKFVALLPRIVRHARRAELVHIQGFYFPPLLALAMLLIRAAGVPVVHTPHNTFDRGRAHRLPRRVMAGSSARTIVHARADLPALPRPERGVVVPLGEFGRAARESPPADRDGARARLGARDDETVVLLYGQLRPDKGIDDLLRAAAGQPPLRVVLAGEELGGLAQAAPELARSELDGRVVVLSGFQDAARTAELFAAADVVALPYRRASQSAVLFLAYGFERPVVVYPVGGLAEAVVPGETGWVCAASTPESLGEALEEIHRAGSRERMRRGAAGRSLAETDYSWASIARKTLGVYREAMA